MNKSDTIELSTNDYFLKEGLKFFRDPVHGSDILLSPYEVKIINTTQFQRLRGIKQLGPCEVVWHGATHNRFQHSLGTLFMVDKILSYADPKGVLVPIEKRIVCRLLALLHDIGHVPFGHTLEDERPAISGKHTDQNRLRMIFNKDIENVLMEIERKMTDRQKENIGIGKKVHSKELQSLMDLIIVLINGCKGESDDDDGDHQEVNINQESSLIPEIFHLYLDIVGNTICADLFDYLKRDTYATGLSRAYDEKILYDFAIQNDHLVLDVLAKKWRRSSTRTEIINLLQVRYTLAERVYFNKTKMWAAAMISKAVELAEIPEEFLIDKRDEELLWLLQNPKVLKSLLDDFSKRQGIKQLTLNSSIPKENYEEPIINTVNELLGEEYGNLWSDIWQGRKKNRKDLEASAKIVNNYRKRNIFRPVYSVTASNTDQNIQELFKKNFYDYKLSLFRYDIESFLAEMCQLEPWEVIIYCPKPKMNLKFADPLVGKFKVGGKQYRHLQDDFVRKSSDPDIKLLIQGADHVVENHKNLWRFYVIAPGNRSRKTLKKLAGLCQDVFKLANELIEYSGTRENIKTIVFNNISIAYKNIHGVSPKAEEVEQIYDKAAKG